MPRRLDERASRGVPRAGDPAADLRQPSAWRASPHHAANDGALGNLEKSRRGGEQERGGDVDALRLSTASITVGAHSGREAALTTLRSSSLLASPQRSTVPCSAFPRRRPVELIDLAHLQYAWSSSTCGARSASSSSTRPCLDARLAIRMYFSPIAQTNRPRVANALHQSRNRPSPGGASRSFIVDLPVTMTWRRSGMATSSPNTRLPTLVVMMVLCS